jgi:hypothetical protein
MEIRGEYLFPQVANDAPALERRVTIEWVAHPVANPHPIVTIPLNLNNVIRTRGLDDRLAGESQSMLQFPNSPLS